MGRREGKIEKEEKKCEKNEVLCTVWTWRKGLNFSMKRSHSF